MPSALDRIHSGLVRTAKISSMSLDLLHVQMRVVAALGELTVAIVHDYMYALFFGYGESEHFFATELTIKPPPSLMKAALLATPSG